MNTLPYTERSNCLTEDIDVAEPQGIVRLLRQVDAQMFSGFDGKEGLLDVSTLDALCALARKTSACIAQGGRVVLSGSGTSGRLAHLLSRTFNRILQQHKMAPCFFYFTAGGDAALFRSTEAPEDNWMAARAALSGLLPAEGQPVVFVGITCGLSAPAVASQLDYCMQRENTTTALLGFSPPELARRNPIEGWDKSFYDVVQAMLKRASPPDIHHSSNSNSSCILITPVVGPEAITGSTRMKGGSATKIALEVAFTSALSMLLTGQGPTRESIFGLLRQYEVVLLF